MHDGDLFLCGIDRRNSFEKVSLAYNDSSKQTRDFIFAGLENINNIMDYPVFEAAKFKYVSIYNETVGRHEAYYESLDEQTITMGDATVALKKGELINVEYRYMKLIQLQVQ
jgi:L-histidine Nalpha-methyltransferase / hercynylcysteine S-oxide synthase